MKYERLRELVQSKEYLYSSTKIMNISTDNQDEAIIFEGNEKFGLLKGKGKNDYISTDYFYKDIDNVEEIKGFFKTYRYAINFKDGSTLKFTSGTWDYKDNENLLEELNSRLNLIKESILDEKGNMLAQKTEDNFHGVRYFIGICFVAGVSFREKEFNKVKQQQFEEKKDGSLSNLTVQAERDNKHDAQAVMILVDGIHIGYIPKQSDLKNIINKLIDMGYGDKISGTIDYGYDSEEKESTVEAILYVSEKWVENIKKFLY